MKSLAEIKGWLVDLDGTLYIGDAPLPGAADFVRVLHETGKHFRFVSNTTITSRRQIAENLGQMGIKTNANEIFTASSAAAELLRSFEGVKCYFAVAQTLMEEFEGISVSETHPDYVVVGDIGEGMTFDELNRIFGLLMGGAELIALQKNRFFRGTQGIQIDAGAYVAALEYATDKQSRIIGKPSRQFFNLAVHDIRVEAGERWLSADFAMIGDDIESDIKGASEAGLISILVKTGKYNDSYSEHFGIVPDFSFDSIRDLAEALQ